MHWKTKARIQYAISLLPGSLSYEAYYWMQRRFGGLKNIQHLSRMTAAVAIWNRILDAGAEPRRKVLFEVGTGRVPTMPVAFWLMGARETITVDLNPYLKTDITKEAIAYAAAHPDQVQEIFGDLLDAQRFDALVAIHSRKSFDLDALLNLCGVQYIAPGDAARTQLTDNCIDFHTSYTVYEHIPGDILRAITREGNRIVNPNGLFVHGIDYSDHFSHSDKSISAINFLQYSQTEFDRFAGNRYMYMNRLRHDDYTSLFESEDQELLKVETTSDPKLAELLESEAFQLHDQFKDKPQEILCTLNSWIVSRTRQKD